MVSVCFLEKQCIKVLLFFKTLVIIILIYFLYQIYEYESNNNFYFNLVFNVIGYGLFYTLIAVYKVYPKGII